METSNSVNPNSSQKNSSSSENSLFECNICLQTATEPVISFCGHLFCWPCIFEWIKVSQSCAVCRSGLTKEKLIPVYGRGSESKDPRTQTQQNEQNIPQRPPGQRSEFNQNNHHFQDFPFSPFHGPNIQTDNFGFGGFGDLVFFLHYSVFNFILFQGKIDQMNLCYLMNNFFQSY